MTGETYFNYGDKISSKRVCEAISMPYGSGPICGFGSAIIQGNTLQVKPYAFGDDGGAETGFHTLDPARFMVRDLILNHYLPKAEDSDISNYRITFGCIAKDGMLFRSGESTLSVPIEGTKTVGINQVILFAEHKYVSEPVNNNVSFRAFWSVEDFFELYKISSDVYYLVGTNRKASISDEAKDPYINKGGNLSYDGLLNKVKSACQTYVDNERILTLIGIYGEGVGPDGSEDFAIIPYGGQFPTPIRYNSAIHSFFKEALIRMENFLSYDEIEGITDSETGEPVNFNTLTSYIKWLIQSETKPIQKQIEFNALPAGSIILYEGLDTPYGWEEYSKANGKIVIGYQAGGISINTTPTTTQFVLNEIGGVYSPSNGFNLVIEGKDLPKHHHGLGIKKGVQDNANDAAKPMICNFSERDSSLKGDFPSQKYSPLGGIVSGAVLSGANITNSSDPASETSNNSLIINKLLPAVTLRYLRKRSME